MPQIILRIIEMWTLCPNPLVCFFFHVEKIHTRFLFDAGALRCMPIGTRAAGSFSIPYIIRIPLS